MSIELILILVLILVIGVMVFINTKRDKNLAKELGKNLRKDVLDELITVAKQQLGAETRDIKTDLTNKRDTIEKLVKEVHEELRRTNKRVEESDKAHVGSFSELNIALKDQKVLTEQLKTSAEGLKNVLSNNQLRGKFGEQIAEDLLKMTGFVKGTDYVVNKSLKEGSRPDLTIFLPDGVKINVDVKFPYANLQKSGETQDKLAKAQFIKLFEADVKEKIKQVTSREYINPEENTVDFVVMFIPTEMVFSFIYEHMGDLWATAMKQKVIFAGPFSFTAILRLVRQSYDNFKYKNNVRKIITYIKTFEVEWNKYNEEFDKIGERIGSLSTQYDKVRTTRTKQLSRSIDRIRMEEGTTENLFDKNDLDILAPGDKE